MKRLSVGQKSAYKGVALFRWLSMDAGFFVSKGNAPRSKIAIQSVLGANSCTLLLGPCFSAVRHRRAGNTGGDGPMRSAAADGTLCPHRLRLVSFGAGSDILYRRAMLLASFGVAQKQALQQARMSARMHWLATDASVAHLSVSGCSGLCKCCSVGIVLVAIAFSSTANAPLQK